MVDAARRNLSLSVRILGTTGRTRGCGRRREEEGVEEKGRKGGFVRPSGINGRENECHLFRNTHPENHGCR